MSQTECATSSSKPARLCRSRTAWYGQRDPVMQGLWKSPSLGRRTWTTVEKKGRWGTEHHFSPRQKPNTKMPKYGKFNIKIQVPDTKPVPGPGWWTGQQWRAVSVPQGKSSLVLSPQPGKDPSAAGCLQPLKHWNRSTHWFSWLGAAGVSGRIGNVDPRNTKSLMQYARNPGRAFLEKL